MSTFVPHPVIFRTSAPLPSPPRRPRLYRPQVSSPRCTIHPLPTDRYSVRTPAIPPPPPLHSIPNHPDWRFMGPPLSEGPLPAIIYLALTSSQSLHLPPFNQPAVHAISLSSNLRVLSVTLPFHSTPHENELALSKWAEIYQSGGDPVSNFVRRASAVIDNLVLEGIVTRNGVVMMGLSRGALLAGLVGAANDNVMAVVGFAPVTDLAVLREFEGMDGRGKERVDRLRFGSDAMVKKLYKTPVRFYIGNWDTRVGTKQAFDTMNSLVEEAKRQGIRAAPHEFNMYCRYVDMLHI